MSIFRSKTRKFISESIPIADPVAQKKIVALIPCFNEEEGIGAVIDAFPRDALRARGYHLDVIVIDNNSNDRTADRARAHGAQVVREQKRGKGNAMRRGFSLVPDDADYIVMLDGDNTYRPEEMQRLIELLESGFCDVAVGSRLGGRIAPNSMDPLNRAGNWFFSHLVRLLYRVNITDVLTGYFAWTRASLMRLRPHLNSDGFALEMEMITKMARLGEEVYSVPITYTKRAGRTSLRPFYDGARILLMCVRVLWWRPAVHRIAFVSDAVMPWNIGGKERRLYEISRRLVGPSREVHIYTMQWWKGPRHIVREGIHFHAICALRPLYHNGRRSVGEALWFALGVFWLLFERFDTLDVDHMPFFPLFSARIVAWLRGKRLYATWHEVWGKEYWQKYLGGAAGYVAYLVERASFLLPDVCIANSRHTTERLRLAGVRVPIKTVPLGADMQSIYNAPLAPIRSDVIYAGRLLSHKGVDILVRSAAIVRRQLPDLTVLIIGTGPEKESLRKLVADLRLERTIQMLDEVEQEALYGLMKSSKVLVLPSTREGFGLVVAEANAAGLPVITTTARDNAAQELIVEGVNGYLCEPDAAQFAEKILLVLTKRETLHPQLHIPIPDWRLVTRQLVQAFA